LERCAGRFGPTARGDLFETPLRLHVAPALKCGCRGFDRVGSGLGTGQRLAFGDGSLGFFGWSFSERGARFGGLVVFALALRDAVGLCSRGTRCGRSWRSRCDLER
jgi:hypothetical protein